MLFEGGCAARYRLGKLMMDMQQLAMNDGRILFGQAKSLITLNFCNLCPTFAQRLPAALNFAVPVCQAASCTASGDASTSELKTISSAFHTKLLQTSQPINIDS
jgi:hypothetical protein